MIVALIFAMFIALCGLAVLVGCWSYLDDHHL